MSTVVGLIGLGKMGHGLALRLRKAQFRVIGADRDPQCIAKAQELGVETVDDMAAVIAALPAGGVLWLMLPAGAVTQEAVRDIAKTTTKPLIVVDGGNSKFADAAEHQEVLAAVGCTFVDIGVSGGQWGWETGYGLMVGASEETYTALTPILDALSGGSEHSRVGECGSGHLVKALHNGVQYAVMQAYAEGFALLEAHEGVDTTRALSAWQSGSSVRSWLLSQMLEALRGNPELEGVSSVVPDSGMGRWTAEEAIRLGVPTPVLTTALYARFHSQAPELAEKLLRASRTQIGGQR